MLSEQICTNLTGSHRRQRSTPLLGTLNQPLFPCDHDQLQLDCRDLKVEHGSPKIFKEEPQQQISDCAREVGNRQQHRQYVLQETQQPDARPGANLSETKSKYDDNFLDGASLPSRHLDNAFLSTEDFNAMLMHIDQPQSNPARNSSDNAMDISLPESGAAVVDRSRQDGDRFNPRTGQGMLIWDSNEAVQLASDPRRFIPVNDSPVKPVQDVTQGSCKKTPSNFSYLALNEKRSAFHHRKSASSTSVRDLGHSPKAQPMQRGQSCQENHSMSSFFGIGAEPLSPPKTAPLTYGSMDCAMMPSPKFLNLSDLRSNMPKDVECHDPAIFSFESKEQSPTTATFHHSPETSNVSLFGNAEVDKVIFDAQFSFLQATQGNLQISGQSSPVQQSPHQRTDSAPFIDVEECTRETGVTAEEIASFIDGPSQEDGKWSCLYEDMSGKRCEKRFARKENAKSHVQTHLGDRQYVCKVCQTPFVRQHDLKRHFKIHTTEKPHQCPCGKNFHRQDALTRHRQRGMCVGAFDGHTKKVMKRGRPKKARPGNEERSEKAARTRQHVMERTKPGSTYASSISGSSDYSASSPPNFDNLSVTASSPSMSHFAFDEVKFPEPCSQPMTPPPSPERCSEVFLSSPLMQHASPIKRTSKSPSPRLTCIPELPRTPEESTFTTAYHGSHNSPPPELELCSSSPATSQFLDLSNQADMSDFRVRTEDTSGRSDPRIFNSDFQLFENSSQDGFAAVKFEDFLDLSDCDSGLSEKRPRAVSMRDAGVKAEGFQNGMIGRMDDPFFNI